MVQQYFRVGPDVAEHGGAPVKAERSLRSEALGRLAVGSVLLAVEEVKGARVHFEKLLGAGPTSGWVSASFLLPISDAEVEEMKVLAEGKEANVLGRSLLAKAEAKVQSLGASKALAEARATTTTELPSMVAASVSLLSLGRPQEAWEVAQNASIMCQKDEDQDAKASTTLLAAIVLLTLRKGQEALQRATDALELFCTLGDQQMVASSLCVIANIHLLDRNVSAALEAAEKALASFRDISDFEGEAMADLIISEASAASASNERSSSSSSSSVGRRRPNSGEEEEEEDGVLAELSKVQALMSSQKFEAAKHAAEDLLFKHVGAAAFAVKAQQQHSHQQFGSENCFLEASALQLAAAATAASVLAAGLAANTNSPDVLNRIGIDLTVAGLQSLEGIDSDAAAAAAAAAAGPAEVRRSLDVALQRAEWSRHLFARLGDKRGEGLAAHTAARLYMLLGEHSFALRVAMEAIVLCRAGEDDHGELSAIHMAVHITARLGRFAEALRLGKELEALAKKSGNTSIVAAIESMLSHIQDATPSHSSMGRNMRLKPKSQLQEWAEEWGRTKLATSASSMTSLEELPACVVWKVPVKSMTYLAYCLEIIKFTEDLKNEAVNVNVLVVTQGVLARQMGEEMPANWTAIGASAIWAVVRNIRMESPKLIISAVDLPPGATPLEIADCIHVAQRWSGPRNEIGFFLDRRHRLQAQTKPKA